MTDLPTISVVVVSWKRLQTLRLCLLGLQQQDHPKIELCLVAEPEAADIVLAALGNAGPAVKFAANPGNNISVARNLGLELAQGEVVAFIDDDAVPEPTWASRLAKAFDNSAVVAATGYTIGRNGISLQWSASEVDAAGQDHALPLATALTLHKGTPERAVKPVGTNCAFRRLALMKVGGFDPAYAFYLEDADIGLRLASHGVTAVVPNARVHHAFAASSRRRSDRVPTDLRQIGASRMVFLRRHLPDGDWSAPLAALREEQQARLDRHVSARRISRSDATAVMATLEAGLIEGKDRPLAAMACVVTGESTEFSRLPGTGPRTGRIVSGRFWQIARLKRQAQAAVQRGEIATVICLDPTPRAHRMEFHYNGFWIQSGGIFGWSKRAGARIVLKSFKARISEETQRIALFRPIC
jgi:O-antigen biosynthesis protein